MNKHIPVLGLGLMLFLAGGCTLNVQESVFNKEWGVSLAQTTRLELTDEVFESSEIRVTGIDDPDTVVVRAVVRGLVLEDDATVNENGFSMALSGADTVGSLSFTSTGDVAQRFTLTKITTRVDSTRDIVVENVNGEVDIDNMGGYIKVDGVNGDISVETVEGCDIETTNGSVSLKIGASIMDDQSVFRGVDVDAVNGSVTIYLPDGFTANIATSTVSGSTTGKNLFHDGNAKRTISVSTVNGDITFKKM